MAFINWLQLIIFDLTFKLAFKSSCRKNAPARLYTSPVNKRSERPIFNFAPFNLICPGLKVIFVPGIRIRRGNKGVYTRISLKPTTPLASHWRLFFRSGTPERSNPAFASRKRFPLALTRKLSILTFAFTNGSFLSSGEGAKAKLAVLFPIRNRRESPITKSIHPKRMSADIEATAVVSRKGEVFTFT